MSANADNLCDICGDEPVTQTLLGRELDYYERTDTGEDPTDIGKACGDCADKALAGVVTPKWAGRTRVEWHVYDVEPIGGE